MKTLAGIIFCLLGSVLVAAALDVTLPTTYSCHKVGFDTCICSQGNKVVSCLPSVNGNGDVFTKVPDVNTDWVMKNKNWDTVITITNLDECKTGKVKCYIYVDPNFGVIVEGRP